MKLLGQSIKRIGGIAKVKHIRRYGLLRASNIVLIDEYKNFLAIKRRW